MTIVLFRLGSILLLGAALLASFALLLGDVQRGAVLAYQSGQQGAEDIFLLDMPTGLSYNLTRYVYPDTLPSWSPDGSELAFTSWRDGSYDLMVASASGRDLRSMGSPDPADWPPGKSLYVFAGLSDTLNMDVFILDSAEASPRNLTHHPAFDALPVLSPDERRIAFISNRDNRSGIYTMNVDGSDLRLISAGLVISTDAPAWSPDSQQLAIVVVKEGGGEIFLVDADGSSPRNLTHHSAWDSSPVWSPDGGQIAFISQRSGASDIYIMNIDGSGIHRATRSAVPDRNPAWRP